MDCAWPENANDFFIYCFRNDQPLTIRTLLELNQKSLRLYGFSDPWKEQKNLENEASLKKLPARLQWLDQVDDINAKWTAIIKGVLAGNYLYLKHYDIIR